MTGSPLKPASAKYMAEKEPSQSPSKDMSLNIGAGVEMLTWNINGLRKVAADHGGLQQLLDQFQADIVEHDLARAQGYHCFFSHCKVRRKPSYSGVATFVRSASGLRTLAATTSLFESQFFGPPTSYEQSLSAERLVEIDAEGRVLVTDHGHFIVFNIYGPCISSSEEDERTDERRMFKRDFLAVLEARISAAIERGRRVVLVGDLNACASQMDHGFTMTDKEFFASQWSKWIRGLLGLDSPGSPRVVDCFRRMHPDRKNAFTCWNTQTGARENNYGTRIDYIVASTAFADESLQSCDIMPEFLGSDHCPVRAQFAVSSPSLRTSDRSTNAIGTGPSERGGVVGSDFSNWPEHPPECSCFYSEVKGKQEKLAKFFVAVDQLLVPSGYHAGDATISTEGSRHLLGSGRLSIADSGPRGKYSGKAESSGSVLGGHSRWRPRTGLNMRQSKLAFVPTRQMESIRPDARGSKAAREWGARLIDRNAETSNKGISDDSSGVSHVDDARGICRRGHESDHREDSRNGVIGPERLISGNDNDDGVLARAPHGGVKGDDEGSLSMSANAWKTFFGKKKSTPLCEHGEPSIQRTVLKQGANHNRRFYTCARFAGNWPSDRNARCNFFQWRLDGVRGYKDRPTREDGNAKRLRMA